MKQHFGNSIYILRIFKVLTLLLVAKEPAQAQPLLFHSNQNIAHCLKLEFPIKPQNSLTVGELLEKKIVHPAKEFCKKHQKKLIFSAAFLGAVVIIGLGIAFVYESEVEITPEPDTQPTTPNPPRRTAVGRRGMQIAFESFFATIFRNNVAENFARDTTTTTFSKSLGITINEEFLNECTKQEESTQEESNPKRKKNTPIVYIVKSSQGNLSNLLAQEHIVPPVKQTAIYSTDNEQNVQEFANCITVEDHKEIQNQLLVNNGWKGKAKAVFLERNDTKNQGIVAVKEPRDGSYNQACLNNSNIYSGVKRIVDKVNKSETILFPPLLNGLFITEERHILESLGRPTEHIKSIILCYPNDLPDSIFMEEIERISGHNKENRTHHFENAEEFLEFFQKNRVSS